MDVTKAVAVRTNGLQLPFGGRDMLHEVIRSRIRDIITQLTTEEMDATLGAGPYERTPHRRGHRHGLAACGLRAGEGGTQEVAGPQALRS